jgi:hypothetical protein
MPPLPSCLSTLSFEEVAGGAGEISLHSLARFTRPDPLWEEPNGDINYKYKNKTKLGEYIGSPLPHIIQWFKTMTTNEFLRIGNHKLWQRNYYEHIIRNESEYNKICFYIQNNP